MYETMSFFASAALGDIACVLLLTFIIEMRHLTVGPLESSQYNKRRKRNEIWQITRAHHLRFLIHHNITISMNVKAVLHAFSLGSQKLRLWSDQKNKTKQSKRKKKKILLVLSLHLFRGRWGQGWINGGGFCSGAYCFVAHCELIQ